MGGEAKSLHVVPLVERERVKTWPTRVTRSHIGSEVVNPEKELLAVPGEVTRYSTDTGTVAAAESVTGTASVPADSATTLPAVAKPRAGVAVSSSVR